MFDKPPFRAAVLATALLIATSATAQTAALVEVADGTRIPMIAADADALEDLDVHDAGGRKIGEVAEVLGPDEATATAIAVDFEDGAGFGREDRVVPLDRFGLVGTKLVLSADSAAVGALPIYED